MKDSTNRPRNTVLVTDVIQDLSDIQHDIPNNIILCQYNNVVKLTWHMYAVMSHTTFIYMEKSYILYSVSS